MPTGYTAKIKDGINFEQFIMGCARAFGATVMMRDEPSDAPIPDEFKPSDYNEKALTKARSELQKLESMPLDDANQESLRLWEVGEANRMERLEENKALHAKYKHMLVQVRGWTPPSNDHKELQVFMREQIESSIKHDCDMSYYSKPSEKLTGQDWLDQQKQNALKDIEYHVKGNAEEIERTNSRNTWIRLLRESLEESV